MLKYNQHIKYATIKAVDFSYFIVLSSMLCAHLYTMIETLYISKATAYTKIENKKPKKKEKRNVSVCFSC